MAERARRTGLETACAGPRDLLSSGFRFCRYAGGYPSGVPITLTQLASFLAVVRTGSVTAAAEELVVTQPSVSAALSALSKEVGVELTERYARSVRPSAAGRAFVPYAADVMGLLERGTRAAREAAGAADAEVRVVSTTT